MMSCQENMYNKRNRSSHNPSRANKTSYPANNAHPTFTQYPIGYHSNGQKAFDSTKLKKNVNPRLNFSTFQPLHEDFVSVDDIIRQLERNSPPGSMDGWMKFGQNNTSSFKGNDKNQCFEIKRG